MAIPVFQAVDMDANNSHLIIPGLIDFVVDPLAISGIPPHQDNGAGTTLHLVIWSAIQLLIALSPLFLIASQSLSTAAHGIGSNRPGSRRPLWA